MLGKLIKHEFRATSRGFGAMYLLVFAITVVLKALMEIQTGFNIESGVMDFISVLTVTAFILGIIAIVLGTYVLIIKRFYDSMLKDEGYLSFTLPVKTWQHIASKIITGYIWVIASGLFICFTVFILLLGDGSIMGLKETFTQAIKAVSEQGAWGYVAEALAVMLVALYVYISMGYACFSIGQAYAKNKVLGALVSYIVIYFILQIISAIMIVVLFGSNYFAAIEEQQAVQSMFQPLMIYSLVLSVIEAIAFTVITNVMLSRKLNLE